MTKSRTKAMAVAAAILGCITVPALANSGPASQDKLAMNTGAPNSGYQDAGVQQAIDVIKAVEKQAGTKIKSKKVLRQQERSAATILILGGAEAFPM